MDITADRATPRSTITMRSRDVSPFWHQRQIDVVLLASATNFLWLWQNARGTRSYNLYYAATVRSMLTSWHAFFFASFDPAGFITIDKPPLGFWIQAASAKLFGFSSWSVLLPQALAGILSVALLGHLVGRGWGSLAGMLAALMLALTPISVATNRSNAVDSLLVLTLLLAILAINHAVETGRLRPILLFATLIGLGFNIKGMEAYVTLPAFALFFLLASPLSGRVRLLHLGIAVAVLLVVSLAWIVVVDSTPASQRPFVGSSNHNSEMDLAFGFNGFNRLIFNNQLTQQIGFGAGTPSPLRMVNRQLGGQVSWLLPLSLLGLLTAAWGIRFRLPLARHHQALVLWGGWFLTTLALFSGIDFLHPHYLVILAPAASALVGIGYAVLLQQLDRPSWQRWLLPLGLVGTALIQVVLLNGFPTWSRWLIPIVICLSFAAALFMAVAYLNTRSPVRAYTPMAAAIGLLSLLIAPTIWVAITVWHPGNGDVPYAGPDLLANMPPQDMDAATVNSLVRYIHTHQHNVPYILATPSAIVAAPLIVATGEPVMAFGGYLGGEQIVTPGRIVDLVARGDVRFFLMPSTVSATPLRESQVEHWIRTRCITVQAALWQPASGFGPEGPQLYDCSKSRRESGSSGGISTSH